MVSVDIQAELNHMGNQSVFPTEWSSNKNSKLWSLDELLALAILSGHCHTSMLGGEPILRTMETLCLEPFQTGTYTSLPLANFNVSFPHNKHNHVHNSLQWVLWVSLANYQTWWFESPTYGLNCIPPKFVCWSLNPQKPLFGNQVIADIIS